MSDRRTHNRQSIRLPSRDYALSGAYYITLNTNGRWDMFGSIQEGEMRLNGTGLITADSWIWLARQYPYIHLDAFIVMPDHLHGIVIIRGSDSRIATTGAENTKIKPLGRLIGAFKTVSTKHINQYRNTPGAIVWQRNYYEHIVRDDHDLARIREYIRTNPARYMGKGGS